MDTPTYHLITEKHPDFLAENRHNPVVGESIKVGDKVVVCAVCHSTFLLESWEYLDSKHCRQKETLAYIPSTKNLKLKNHIVEESFY